MSQKCGEQSILCSVESCRFNENRSACNLDTIIVNPTGRKSNEEPKLSSCCGSYQKR